MSESETGERVLIVDDEAVVRDALSRFLRRSGFEVVEAGSVVDAMDELMSAARRNQRFHHAVIDLILRDGDGEDVLRACESLTPRPNVVVLSGNIDARRALSLSGRCLPLPKPVAARTLVEALRRRDRVSDFVQRYGLKDKEREALVVAVRGLFNDEAADVLGVTKEALRKRWRQICTKTGCASQQTVLALVIRELTSPPDPEGDPLPGVSAARPAAAGAVRRATR